MEYEATKLLGSFRSVRVERQEWIDEYPGTSRSMRGYKVTPFRKSEAGDGSVLIDPEDVASVLAVIQADVEEMRREFSLRVEIGAIQKHRKA